MLSAAARVRHRPESHSRQWCQPTDLPLIVGGEEWEESSRSPDKWVIYVPRGEDVNLFVCLTVCLTACLPAVLTNAIFTKQVQPHPEIPVLEDLPDVILTTHGVNKNYIHKIYPVGIELLLQTTVLITEILCCSTSNK